MSRFILVHNSLFIATAEFKLKPLVGFCTLDWAKRIILFLLLCLSFFAAHAQKQTISVSGQVRCGTELMVGSLVAMLQPSDSSIVAYTTTDKQGRYTLQTTTHLSEVLLRVTGFNLKRKVVRIKAQTQTFDFNVEEENKVLREALVKSKKLWGGRDTLNYLVSAYTRGQDRSIGDVLRQLPGITIEDNGVIKYQGTPINHFYIENLDMLQGRYNLATQGIKAEDVATVQVLENHEHIRARQDQTPPEHAAINLKLKDRAKGVWSKTAVLGVGGYADGFLWETTLQAMFFGKRKQHMIRYGGDNLGRTHEIGTNHYGISSRENLRMVALVEHASPPVGNSLFGYRHNVNFNNLVKLSDSTTINYNFNYSHNFVHGQSFSQTTYLLPDGTQQLLLENIADSTHTNTANLQLVYEKNQQYRYLKNTLSLWGRWDDGRGSIRSEHNQPSLADGTNGESSISQDLHYRSLGLINNTRWVYRTAKGGGFEWVSTNSLSSTPQSLAIGDDRTARQDIELTALSTINSFRLLRDLRSRKWAISASASLNTTYTALTSTLNHPDMPIAPHGDMSHLRASVDFGPIGQYTNGTFQTTLSAPVALTYTNLNNAAISGENTDAHRLRLYVQPSFSLLWKATDHFTLNASAHYSASETPWMKLLTANVMQNYRSLSRYRAKLSDNYGAGAQFKVAFKDLFTSLFAHIEGGWQRAWSDIAYGTTLDAQANTIVEAAYMPNHSNRYTLTAYGRKDFDWQTLQIELSATGSWGKSEMLRQSVLTTYCTTGYALRGTLAFDLVSGCRIDYRTTWLRQRSVAPHHTITYNELNQRAQLSLRLLPSRLFLKLHASHTHNSSLSSGKKDYLFIGSGLQFKLSKKIEFNLNGDNLTNIHTYSSRSIGDMESYYTEYYLRPRSVTLTVHIYL